MSGSRAILESWRGWSRAFIPEAVPSRFGPHHTYLDGLIEGDKPTDLRSVIVAHRGAAKSTAVKLLALQALDSGRRKAILIVRDVGHDAAADIENLERLMVRSGRAGLKPTKVNKSEAMIQCPAGIVWARTRRGTVRGLQHVRESGEIIRPDLAIIDDVEDKETARSAMQTERIEDMINSDVIGTQDAAAGIDVIVLGTPLSPLSMIARAQRGEDDWAGWDVVEFPYRRADGSPLWDGVDPDRIDLTTAARTVAQEYKLEAVASGDLLFPAVEYVEMLADGEQVWVSVDPAAGGADATAMAAARFDAAESLFDVVDSAEHRGPHHTTSAAVVGFVHAVQASGWVVAGINVEAVGPWKHVADEIAVALPGLKVVYETPKASKLQRLTPWTLWAAHRRLRLSAHLKGSPLAVELATVTSPASGQLVTATGHDDNLDAMSWVLAVVSGVYRNPQSPGPRKSDRVGT